MDSAPNIAHPGFQALRRDWKDALQRVKDGDDWTGIAGPDYQSQNGGAYRLWTDDDRQQLKRYWRMNWRTADIALFLRRTARAVESEAERMNLPARRKRAA